MATLEEFLKEYIGTKRAQSTKESFASWAAKYGINAEDNTAKNLRNLDTGYAKSISGYGALAEELADSGLIGGGYGEYLERASKRRLAEYTADEIEGYADDFRKNAEGYAKYSKEYETDLAELKRSIINDIKASGTLDYDAAYLFAINAGLPDGEATAAAKSGSDMARQEATALVYDKVINKRLGFAQTVELAKGLGFSESEARELGEFARLYGEYRYGESGLSYSEYLKGKLNELKEKGDKVY